MRKKHLYSIASIVLISLLLLSCATHNKNNKEVEGLLTLGQHQIISEQYTDAIASYKKVLSIDQKNIDGLYGLARTYLLSDDLVRSAKVILTLSSIDISKSYSLTKTYASLLYDSGEIEKSLTTLYSLYNTNVYDKDLAMLLIDRYLENDYIDKAYEVATKAYQYHYKDKALIKKIAQITEKGNLPDKKSWAVLAK